MIEAVQRQSAPISYRWLRARFGRDNDLWEEIGRGRRILQSSDQLDQYLYSYGPMIAGQWETVAICLSVTGTSFRLIDYGCGQGLAGLLLSDRLGPSFMENAVGILLIEPSAPALVRAEAIYRSFAPRVPIACLCKRFDEIAREDILADPFPRTIHVFSNVLDVEGFDQIGLFHKALTPGRHTCLVVSNDREHRGGSGRIRAVKNWIEHPSLDGWRKVTLSEIVQFTCNGDKNDAIAWLLQLDVTNG